MAKQHIVFLTEEEIKTLANLCRVTLMMAEDANYWKALEANAKTAGEKLAEKIKEIDGG